MPAWDALVNAAASALLAAFGIWLWTLNPRTRLSGMLGLFAVAHGVVYIFENLFEFTASSPLGAFMTLGWATAAFGLLATAREVLRPLGARGLQIWRLAVAGVGLLVVLILVWGTILVFRLDLPFYPLRFAGVTAHTTFLLGSAILPLVFAWLYRHPSPGQEDRVRREAPILSAALLLWPVRWALRDGRLSRAEERRLMQLGHHLGIEPRRAAAIQDEIEAESRDAGREVVS